MSFLQPLWYKNSFEKNVFKFPSPPFQKAAATTQAVAFGLPLTLGNKSEFISALFAKRCVNTVFGAAGAAELMSNFRFFLHGGNNRRGRGRGSYRVKYRLGCGLNRLSRLNGGLLHILPVLSGLLRLSVVGLLHRRGLRRKRRLKISPHDKSKESHRSQFQQRKKYAQQSSSENRAEKAVFYRLNHIGDTVYETDKTEQ